ncbi:MAG: efflux RND transporter periplasmic adaptor subunit, partial [Xanthobacteraceae bacterium]
MLLDRRTEPGDRDHTRRFSCRLGPRSICTVALLVTSLIAATPVVAQQQRQQTVPVGTVYAERRPISQSRDFVGRVEAIDRVSVQARVTGYLEAILFTEGDFVKKGDPLYHIERGLFEAAVEQARGAVERSKAAKTLTQIQLQRAEELLARNAGTAVARDQALAADQQAEGQILSDQANLDNANINLGYTDIRAPISGKISKSNITVGNVVGPSSGVLTVI